MSAQIPLIPPLQKGDAPGGWERGSLLKLRRSLIEQATGNSQQLDLVGSVESIPDFRVPSPLLQQVQFTTPQAASQFNTLQGEGCGGASGLGFGHGSLGGVGLGSVRHPGRAQGQQAG